MNSRWIPDCRTRQQQQTPKLWTASLRPLPKASYEKYYDTQIFPARFTYSHSQSRSRQFEIKEKKSLQSRTKASRSDCRVEASKNEFRLECEEWMKSLKVPFRFPFFCILPPFKSRVQANWGLQLWTRGTSLHKNESRSGVGLWC